MNLQEATQHIRGTALAMNKDFQSVLFDELAIVSSEEDKEVLIWYDGPRRPEFIKRYSRETAALRAESRSGTTRSYHIGDFEFTHEGHGSQSEAFLVLGDHLYLICGNTALSMDEISRDAAWLRAQRHFVVLSERFRFDPLVLTAPPGGPKLAQ